MPFTGQSIRLGAPYNRGVSEAVVDSGSGEATGLRGQVAEFLHRARTTRDVAIVEGVARVAPAGVATMLDIGCSDGRIASRVAARLGAPKVQGVDVQLQDDAVIDVTVYDGLRLPFDDGSFDLVTIVDVLHHCSDQPAVFREALRVTAPTGRVVVKDHVKLGPWSDRVLLQMDTASNFGVHELTRGRYLSMPEWVSLVADSGGVVEELEWPFRVHGLPWRMVARDSYHLLMAIRPVR